MEVSGIERGSTVYRGVLISVCWNRGVQSVEIEGFRVLGLECWNRGV